MSDKCSLYLGTTWLPPAAWIRALAPDAQVTADREEGWTDLRVQWPDLRLEINRMHPDAAPQHLDGFRGYIWTQLAGQRMDARVHQLLERAGRTRHVLGTVTEPGLDAAGRAWGLLMHLAQASGALVFWNNSVLDSAGRYYLAPGGRYDPASQIPVFPSALARKARSEARLQALGIPYIPHLPPVAADEEALLRDADEVAERAVALLAVALRGEGMESDAVLGILRDHGFEEALSPKEAAFLNAAAPTPHERTQFAWRYEGLYALLWALGHFPALKSPGEICDVPEVAGKMKEIGLRELVAGARLRPLPEILEELDFTYRCHWAVVDARANDRPAPPGLDPGVVYERHYALNWLTGYGDEEWDDVSTDT